MNQTKGFVTIATGNDWYFTLAKNLLRSYRLTSEHPLPFAIIADKENDITREFDKTIILDDPTKSYIDKLRLGQMLPYSETIFIDADCLVYSDINQLFGVFADAADVSCFGMIEPLAEENKGWFSLSSFPASNEADNRILTRSDAKERLPYSVGLHGGLIYMRRTDLTTKVFSDALDFAENYSEYKFPMFQKPADEPVLALSMALNRCKPIPYDRFGLTCLWTDRKAVLNMYRLKAHRTDGVPIQLLHLGTRLTKTPIYKKQIDQLHMRITGVRGFAVFLSNLKNSYYIIRYKLRKKRK